MRARVAALATLTHARLRAAQGDLSGARRILAVLLAERPDRPEALALLRSLDGLREASVPDETDEPLASPSSAVPAELALRFREALNARPRGAARTIRRLSDWLARCERRRGPERSTLRLPPQNPPSTEACSADGTDATVREH